MVKYAREPEDATKSCKARGGDLRTHFKNMRETAMAIKKMGLEQAKTYLEEVIAMRRCVVFRRYCGGAAPRRRRTRAPPTARAGGRRSPRRCCSASSRTPSPTPRCAKLPTQLLQAGFFTDGRGPSRGPETRGDDRRRSRTTRLRSVIHHGFVRDARSASDPRRASRPRAFTPRA